MKKLLLGTILISSIVLLSGCGSKKSGKAVEGTAVEQKEEAVQVIEGLTVTEADTKKFDTLVGGSWYKNDDTGNLFTFRGDNTFSVTANGSNSRGPWIVSEGKIVLGEVPLTLEIINNDEITIDGIAYTRADSDA